MLYKTLKQYGYGHRSLIFPEKHLKLHCMISSCGYENQTSTAYDWNGLYRGNAPLIVWQYTLSGRGKLDFAGKQYDVLPGSLMMVYIPHDHRYFLPASSKNWEFLYICMNGSEIIRICRDLINQTGPLTPLAEDSPTLHTALKIFEQMFKGEINTPQQASLLAYELGMELINDISSINGEQSSEPNIIDKVTRYCLEHLDEPIGVEEMSQAAGYSRFHFSRLFHKYQGDSPASFLRELRLQKALQLLQTDRLKIKAIAERCGFQSASYFARAFQKKFGCYPRAFKESAKK